MGETKQKKEIEDLKKFNTECIKDIGLFYLPSWANITVSEFYNKDYEYIIGKIHPLQAKPEYRSAIRLFYNQFKIFKPFMQQIDSATLSFFEGNYISACFTLAPLVDGLLIRWANGNEDYKSTLFVDVATKGNRNNFLEARISSLKQKHNNDVIVCHNLDILKIFTENYFEFSTRSKNKIKFNRERLLHLLAETNQKECFIYSLHLFAVLDLIVWCYSYEFTIEEHKKEEHLLPEEIIEKEQKEFIKYFEILIICKNYSPIKK